MGRYKQIEYFKENYINELPEPKPTWPRNIRKSFILVISHLFDPKLTITFVKEQCRINSKSFASHFNRYLNRHPKEFIMYHRIEVAKQLMKQTEATVTTVALSVGFNSLSSFGNSFKAREDLTPSQWREQN